MSSLRSIAESRIEKGRLQESNDKMVNNMIKDMRLSEQEARSQEMSGIRRAKLREETMTSVIKSDEAEVRRVAQKESVAISTELRNELRKDLELAYREDQGRMAMKQRIIEESVELKELRGKIEAAKLNRVRAAQLLEKQYRTEKELDEERKKDDDVLRFSLAEEERDLETQEKYLKQETLNREIREKHDRDTRMMKKEAEERINEEERKLVMNAVGAVMEQENKELLIKNRKRDEVRQQMISHIQEKNLLDAQKKKEEESQELQILEYERLKTKQLEAEHLQKEEKEKQQTEIYEVIASQYKENMNLKEDLEYYRNELYLEEKEKSERKKKEAEDYMKIMRMKELTEFMNYQKNERENQRKEQDAEDARMRQEMMENYQEAKKLEQLSKDKRRMMLMDYRKEADAILAEKRKIIEEKQKKEQDDDLKMLMNKHEEQKVISEEKERLLDYLKKYASHV